MVSDRQNELVGDNEPPLQVDSFAGPWISEDNSIQIGRCTRLELKEMILEVLLDADDKLSSNKAPSMKHRYYFAYIEALVFMAALVVIPNFVQGDGSRLPPQALLGILLLCLPWAFIFKRAQRFECPMLATVGWGPYLFETSMRSLKAAGIFLVVMFTYVFISNRI